ncbi:MAG: SOS response-associated peptidase [Bacteroidota bacterium]
MCYNKSTVAKLVELQKQFEIFNGVKGKDVFKEPNYNALRLQKLPIIARRDGDLTAFRAQWWLIPHWSKTGKPEVTAFNARAETLDSSRLFAPYFKGSRCVVPVSAFYEYSPEQVEITVNGKTRSVKQPYVIRMKDGAPFLLAGIFSVWVDPKSGEELPTYAVITTGPNSVMEPIHNRMPVILDTTILPLWLDRDFKDTKELKKALVPSPASPLKAHKVSAGYLYDRSHTDPKCWDPTP